MGGGGCLSCTQPPSHISAICPFALLVKACRVGKEIWVVYSFVETTPSKIRR